RSTMKRNVLLPFCAAMALILAAWLAPRARAEDDDQGDDCGTAVVAEDDDNQADDDVQGDEDGCGMMVVEGDDENGEEVDDMEDTGVPEDDVDVDVEEPAQSGANQGTMLQIHTTQNGSFVLKGLPKGRVTITATRVHDGVTTVGSRKKHVREQRTRRMRLRLHPAPSQ